MELFAFYVREFIILTRANVTSMKSKNILLKDAKTWAMGRNLFCSTVAE